jgi:quinol monooxygenase YgiN
MVVKNLINVSKRKESTMGVRVVLSCKVNDNQLDGLLPFLESNLPNVRSFKGNMRVSVLYDKTNNEMQLDEEWLSVESHQSYLQFIENNGVLAELASFFSEPPKINYYEAVNI